MSTKPLILQRPHGDEEARANLLSYINIRDRGAPPIFVGREEIIQRLAKDVAECRSNTQGSTCFTRVIQGAPGAGKTSLIEKLKERFGSPTDALKRFHDAVVVLSISGGMFFREAFVANKLIEACIGKDFDVQVEKNASKSAQAGGFGLGASYRRATKERSLEQQIQSAGELWNSVIDNTSVNKDDTVFLLLIDEAQSIRGVASEHGENHIVMNLHEGLDAVRGLKIVPVFAGLSDTESVLAERGISRLPGDASIQIGSFTRDETEELVGEWMRYKAFDFEELFSRADIDRVSKMIAVASEGWPRHATTYLRELGRSILEQGVGVDMQIDLDEVFERGHDDRLRYYDDRLRVAKLGKYRRVIRDAAQQSADGIVELEVLTEIAESEYGLSEEKCEDLHEKAIHAGILEPAVRNNDERFKFPIPSFFSYMQYAGDEMAFKAKMREHMDAESHRWSTS